jgi:phosphoenolpyruvate phosphomutase
VVVDSSAFDADNRTVRDFAYCSRADDRGLFGTPVRLERIVGSKPAPLEGTEPAPAAHGRWIGLLNVSRAGTSRLKRVLAQLQAQADFESLDMPALINALVADGAAIDVQYVHGHWRGVNDLEDLHSAVDFAHAQAPIGGVQEGPTGKAPDARGA